MTLLVKYKNQIEYSFYTWISQFPDSGHPNDQDRFLSFVRNVCRYNGKRWKDNDYLKDRILKEYPHFDEEALYELLSLYYKLIKFYKTNALPSSWVIEDGRDIENGLYLERGIKKGNKYEKKLPIERYGKNNNKKTT